MINIRPLSNELQKIATEELNEIQERIPEDLQHIRNWLEKQPHLNVRSDDQWLITFLRGCKYSLEKVKAKLDLYYSLRPVLPEYFQARYPFSTALSEILKASSFMVLSQSTSPPTPTIVLTNWDVCSAKKCSLIDIEKFWFMAFEVLLREDDNAVVCGVEVIGDYSQFTINCALQMTPIMLKKIMLSVEKAYPIRLKGLHVINAPPMFETIYLMAKPFMTKKLKNRVFVYSPDSISEFYKHGIPKHIMPKEYGGNNDSIYKLAENFNKKVESYGEWFLDDEKYSSNESLRPPDLRSAEDILGLEGSFRKLNVD